jgi:hypothetical protein
LNWFTDLKRIEAPPFVDVIHRIDPLLSKSLNAVAFAPDRQLKELWCLNDCSSLDRIAIHASLRQSSKSRVCGDAVH